MGGDEIKLMLSALLHDVGKFWQRAGGRGKHWDLSDSFINTHVPERWRSTLAKQHHDYEKFRSTGYVPLKRLIVADWLSAGERAATEEEVGSRGVRETPLVSIFSKIDIKRGSLPPKRYYNVEKLTLDESIFPSEHVTDLPSRYEALWKEFVEEVEAIKWVPDFEAYFNTLLFILRKYTWCVPSAVWRTEPDISLFDHLKMTCAIASCLDDVDEEYCRALFKREKKELTNEERGLLDEKKFMLVAGDISGVQRFIYSITTKGAAKGLRGRSLYLQLLSESMAGFILKKLGLPLTNLLFCGGGHFYILAPSEAERQLASVRAEVAGKLLEAHRGELYLALAGVSFSTLDMLERFNEVWQKVGKMLAREKRRKFAEILDEHKRIFGPGGETGAICDVCGGEGGVREETERKICEFCWSLEELARELHNAKYLVEIRKEGIIARKKWESVPADFGYKYVFCRDVGEAKRIVESEGKDAEHVFIYKLNETSTDELREAFRDVEIPVSFGFKFLTLATPLKEETIRDVEGRAYKREEIKDFDGIAEGADGVRRWAVLRADVDDLGMIFSAVGKEGVSRVSTLSSMLSLFFGGCVEKICSQGGYKDIYAIYSGGDDLFIVGPWSELPKLACRIYEDFRKFTCENPNVTLSSAISMAPAVKYPLYRVARDAGDALDDKSKRIENKDAITFLEMPMKWEKFNAVTGLKDEIIALLGLGVSRSLLQRLYNVYAEFRRQSEKYGEVLARHDDRYGRWRWLLAYSIARMRSGNRHANEKLEELKMGVCENIEYLAVSVRWAELLTRRERVEEVTP